MEFFGYELKKQGKQVEKPDKLSPSPFAPTDIDGSIDASVTQGHSFDFDASWKNTGELINTYRSMAMNADCASAIDEIVNDAIVFDVDESPVELVLDDVEVSDAIKTKLTDEFKTVLGLFDFNEVGDDIFKEWYVDGRIFYHIVLSKTSQEKNGIAELRRIDPRHIKKVRNIIKEKGPGGIELVKGVEEYYIYSDPKTKLSGQGKAIKIPKEAIIYVSSGIKSLNGKDVLSHLHPAVKPFNQLVALEDSVVVYRISRAPERRVFYVDVGKLPKTRAEQYMRSLIANHKNKMVYDVKTGAVKDAKNVVSMMEDIWLPRREGSRGTEVETLPGGQNLGEMDDVLYFLKKLFTAMKIPKTRLDSENSVFNSGRSNEITRDEIKFSKFIDKVRKRFSRVFRQALKTQLILKNIITTDDWEKINEQLRFRFNTDSQFAELKEMEILTGRMEILGTLDEYVGKYFSQAWVQKNVLSQTEEEIKEIDKEIKDEIAAKKYPKPGFEEEGGGF